MGMNIDNYPQKRADMGKLSFFHQLDPKTIEIYTSNS
jgi:hypothetical protein